MDGISPENTEKSEEFRQNLKRIRSKDRKIRPRSASKYIGSIPDYTQTCKTYKRYSNPSIIEKILKKSLNKAKNQKNSQKKESKLKVLKSELKKHELDYHNKKIRLNNSLSIKNKKPRSKEKPQKNTENTISITLKTDGSPPVKKSEVSLISSSKRPKKKSISDRKTKDPNILEYIRKKKSQKSQLEYQEKLKKNAEKFVKVQNLQKLENFITKSFRKSPESSFSSLENDSFTVDPAKSGVLHDVNRNISFIYEECSEKSFSREEDFITEKGPIIKTFENDFKFTETLEDDRKSTDFIYKTRDGFGNTQKSPEFNTTKFKFPSVFEVQLQENIHICNQRHKTLTQETNSGPSIQPKQKFLNIFHENNTFITPPAKSFQNSTTQTTLIQKIIAESSFGVKKTKKNLTITPNSSISIQRQVNLTSLDQYSWNLAVLFLIDQLHLYEISDFTENFPSVSSSTLKKIGKKYVGLKDFLQNSFENISSSLVEDLNFEQHTNFIQQTHEKKIEIQKVLTEIFEECLESSEEDLSIGIMKSQSLKSLHEDSEKIEKTEKKKSDIIVSFGFENEENKETSCVISISDGSSGYIMDSLELKNFVEIAFQYLNWEKILKDLKTPLYKNPLQELDKLQETQIGSPTETQIFNFPELFETSAVLQKFEDHINIEPYEKTHRKMILHVLNYLLQQFRPFSYKGLPLPWSSLSLFSHKPFPLSDIKEKILSDFHLMNSFQIGSIVEIDPWIKKPSEKTLVRIKESQLDKILFFEALIDEERWTDYEFEESQVKIDLGDLILQDLALELIKCVE